MTDTDGTTRSPAASPPHAASSVQRDALARLRGEARPVQVEAPRPPQAKTPPPPPTPTLSRGQILDATETVLDEAGYDGATIRRIAKQLDCAVGSIYRYFRDKRELLSAVTQRRFEPVLEQVEAGAAWQDTATAYVRTALEQPQQYRLMFWLAGCDQRGLADAPAIIGRLLDAWAGPLGGRHEAERRWAPLHAGIMLGRNAEAILGSPPRNDAPPAGGPPGGVGNQSMLARVNMRSDDLTLL